MTGFHSILYQLKQMIYHLMIWTFLCVSAGQRTAVSDLASNPLLDSQNGWVLKTIGTNSQKFGATKRIWIHDKTRKLEVRAFAALFYSELSYNLPLVRTILGGFVLN